MKTAFKLLGRILLLSSSIALVACSTTTAADKNMASSASASANFTEGKPGGVYTQNITLVAKVSKIDYNRRVVTLVDDQGKSHRLAVGPDATNFSKVKVGDRVTVQMVDQLAVYMKDKNAKQEDHAATMVGKADESADKPAGFIANTMEITATVKAVDVENHTVKLLLPNKAVRTVAVRPDVVLSKDQVGHQVVIRITSAMAISIDPAN